MACNRPEGIDPKTMKNFGFGLRAFKKYPEIVPLVSIIAAAALGITAFSMYAFMKTDVITNKKRPPPYERINPEQPQKLLTINQEYKKIPELEALKEELKQ